MKRRTFLKIGSTALTASGLDGILAARRAPAFGQTTRIHLLHWPDFIPEGDVELRRQIAEYNKQMKTDVFMENINGNDLQPRITAAIQTGAGPDIVFMLHNWPHLYASSLADVSDLCEWKAKDQGGYYDQSEAAARDGIMLAPGVVFRPHLERSPWMRFNVAICDDPRVQRWLARAAAER